MEHETYPDGFLEERWNPRSAAPEKPLFEEPETAEPEEKGPSLEGRVETLEYRLGRALLCLDRCQKEQAELQKGLRELAREQRACQDRQERHRTITRYGMYTMIGLIFAVQAKSLANLGWQLFNKLALLLDVEPTMVAGVLLAIVILWLAVKLGRALVLKLLTCHRKGRCNDAVCDR